jgi:hypothetical protein
MTHQDECPVIDDLTALLIEHGPAAMASALATLMNHAMQIEREQVKKWDSEAYVHMFRKTSLQYARAGHDAAQSLAKDARVSEGVMMTSYVKEEDLQFRAGSNAMYQRLCLSMTPEVTRAFGHEHSATAILEQRLRGAIGSRNWPLVVEVAKKLAKQDRQAG